MNKIMATKIMAGTLAVAAIALCAGTSRAADLCQWTGVDWACRTGNVFTEHFPANAGPNMIIQPAQAPIVPSGQAVPVQYGRPQ